MPPLVIENPNCAHIGGGLIPQAAIRRRGIWYCDIHC